MNIKKANKRRRLQIFRKEFIKNKENYSFYSTTKCLFGQMRLFVETVKSLPHKSLCNNYDVAAKFFGVSSERFERLYGGDWGTNNWGFDNAVSILDILIAEKAPDYF